MKTYEEMGHLGTLDHLVKKFTLYIWLPVSMVFSQILGIIKGGSYTVWYGFISEYRNMFQF